MWHQPVGSIAVGCHAVIKNWMIHFAACTTAENLNAFEWAGQPPIIAPFLGTTRISPQTASRSVQPILHSTSVLPTDRQTRRQTRLWPRYVHAVYVAQLQWEMCKYFCSFNCFSSCYSLSTVICVEWSCRPLLWLLLNSLSDVITWRSHCDGLPLSWCTNNNGECSPDVQILYSLFIH